ncbi:putative membrane protein [Klebsiella phage vB_KpnS-VAC7]|uniref:Membrane protein n=2 Tax=Webervirus TaxID=1920860 RepID=A0AAE8BZ86_9CAUD|nr:hypothetical protein [Klebsiella phage vB_KpnS-VAC6]QZE50777.1 putative membrane protein [Klebsiella phage vB_KpnS-VAC7]
MINNNIIIITLSIYICLVRFLPAWLPESSCESHKF